MALLKTYLSLVKDGVIDADAAQARTAADLDALQEEIRLWRPKQTLLARLFGRANPGLGRPRQDHADGFIFRDGPVRTKTTRSFP
jgi:hypothetical protein